MTPPPEQLIVRADPDGIGVVYVGKELIGYRVVLVPVEPVDAEWVEEARK
jgi:hypothetical protein